MVEYNCDKCGRIFNKKSTWKDHVENRKKPCDSKVVHTTKVIAPDAPVVAPDAPVVAPEVDDEGSEKQKEFCCQFCNLSFTRNSSLTRHLQSRCKAKNHDDKPKKKQNDNEDKINLILKQNEELKSEIEKLKSTIKKTKPNKSKIKPNQNVKINQQNINNNINQPININVVNNIVNFNDMNYNNVDKKLFIEPIMDRRLFGKAIILKMIENIYINENLPEYQNLVITDKNRGYVKIYNDGKWKTDNLNTINLVLNGIVDHSKLILDELYERYLNNNQAKNRLNTSEKYINYCDLEHLEELKEEQENDDADNTNQIKRCEEFREMVFKDTINLFHDNKNILLKLKKI
jgi:hypothetical protein